MSLMDRLGWKVIRVTSDRGGDHLSECLAAAMIIGSRRAAGISSSGCLEDVMSAYRKVSRCVGSFVIIVANCSRCQRTS